jgi:4-hydroxy-2-oxoheptanedioate aldolase
MVCADNIITYALKKGHASIGCSMLLPGSFTAELMGGLGFPWVLVDLQHGANGWEGILPVVHGLELAGTSALVRVGHADPSQIMRALDMGAIGVVVPMVNTPAEAARVAEAGKYPPLGRRSFGPVRGQYGKGGPLSDALCFAMIETREGLANVAAIAMTPGIDGIILGPGDLAIDLGLGLGDPLPPPVIEAADAIVRACRQHGKIPGSFSFRPDMTAKLLTVGMRLIAAGGDLQFLAEGGRAAAAECSKLASSVNVAIEIMPTD